MRIIYQNFKPELLIGFNPQFWFRPQLWNPAKVLKKYSAVMFAYTGFLNLIFCSYAFKYMHMHVCMKQMVTHKRINPLSMHALTVMPHHCDGRWHGTAGPNWNDWTLLCCRVRLQQAHDVRFCLRRKKRHDICLQLSRRLRHDSQPQPLAARLPTLATHAAGAFLRLCKCWQRFNLV